MTARNIVKAAAIAAGRARLKIVAASATAALVAFGLAGTFASSASASSLPFYVGEALTNVTHNAPLHDSPCDSCAVITTIPYFGWVTMGNEYTGTGTSGFCKVNWRGQVGWTGCWRLDPTADLV
jgi:hypothetical protein